MAHAGEPDQQARRGSQEELPGHVELGGEQTAMRTPQLIRESNRLFNTHLILICEVPIVHRDCTRMFCS